MSSSRRHALPAGLLSFFGTPMDLGLQALQQMNTDPATLSLLDSSLYLALDDSTMSLSLDPRPFATAPTQQHSLPAAFSPVDSTGNGAAPATIAPPMNAPRPRDSPGPPVNPNNNATGSSSNNATHTLTEFTRRRNWPAKVVEELQDLLQILDANGRIKHLSPSAERLTGYTLPELRDVFLQSLLHPDDVGVFTSELNESIASGAPLRVFYRLRRKDGQYAVFEAVGHGHIAAARFGPNPENQTPFCQAVFMMARPYPAKNAALLDSFLEHKMENERLKRKIAELRREEQEEAEESERSWRELQETPPSDSGGSSVGSVGGGAGVGGRPALVPLQHPQQHPQRATLDPMLAGSSSLLRERRLSLDSGSTGGGGGTESIAGNTGARQQQPPSSTTGLSTHADTIEMLTGLRYQEGERSRGITTGSPTPALITGDVGIAIPVDRDRGSGEKKKKIKVAEEYVCTDCGTLESPEWRKGPRGPKTLCNACGLRWAKKEKKRSAHPAEHHAQGDDAAG